MARISLIACWVLLGLMVGLLLTIVSPLREFLGIPEDLSNYVASITDIRIDSIGFSAEKK